VPAYPSPKSLKAIQIASCPSLTPLPKYCRRREVILNQSGSPHDYAWSQLAGDEGSLEVRKFKGDRKLATASFTRKVLPVFIFPSPSPDNAATAEAGDFKVDHFHFLFPDANEFPNILKKGDEESEGQENPQEANSYVEMRQKKHDAKTGKCSHACPR
jgi:hypothetical protein